jgi:hypothetical protein
VFDSLKIDRLKFQGFYSDTHGRRVASREPNVYRGVGHFCCVGGQV